ncbi:ferredoxin-fold anticodon-binding domain-containing protein 1 isoform X2 [Brachyhypopomus gauderio]|uniref:ferredoxin-fold anticodon-binding domain-containing protein 1 isoform X2 n=1 Tax=Brachyhypopomus gauderio TaxID=698409 RepID=UPI0040416F52
MMRLNHHDSATGATVLFEVDCTRLKEHEDIQKRLYDCVIFNFPHCGRKSGVKKNRALLAKFFLSSSEVLHVNGEVHVTLCNGQGGTPRDNPMREWHNSWQVVAMAAEAGLILSNVRPFDADKYRGYRCTGYRSQDKGFHVEGALNHVFTRSLPYVTPEKLRMEAVSGKQTVKYELPEELNEYVNREFLGQQSHHPVKLVLELLLREVKSSWPVCPVSGSFPELVRCEQEQLGGCDSSLTPSDVYWIRQTETHPLERRTGGERDCGSAEGTAGCGCYCLRPSLLLHVQDVVQSKGFSPGTLHSLSGLVFRRVPVSRCCSPVFHQLLLVGALPSEETPLRCLRDCLEGVLAPYDASFKEERLGEEWRVTISSQDQRDVGRITSVSMAGSEPRGSLQLCVVLLDLDRLASLTFAIPDWRLLWSADPRFLAHFEQQPTPGPFRPFSLHPPSYTHDVSFWVEPDAFDDLSFHAAVRVATGGAVRDVQLVERFRHPHMGHASMCYRLTYQSPDRALSRSRVLELQDQLRRLLPLRLQVTLR